MGNTVFGRNLAKRRKALGLTQEQLAMRRTSRPRRCPSGKTAAIRTAKRANRKENQSLYFLRRSGVWRYGLFFWLNFYTVPLFFCGYSIVQRIVVPTLRTGEKLKFELLVSLWKTWYAKDTEKRIV